MRAARRKRGKWKQGGTGVLAYSGMGTMVQVGDTDLCGGYAGLPYDNVVIKYNCGDEARAPRDWLAYTTQEMDLESLTSGQRKPDGKRWDGTRNLHGGTFL